MATIDKHIRDFLWRSESNRFGLRFVRALYLLAHDLANGYIDLHAKSLVYTTLLSIVPFFAVSFSILKILGVHNHILPLLKETLTPLGEKGADISQQIIQFIDNVDVGVLGFVGVIMLLYTVVSTVSKIEEAFNHIWHVDKPRSLLQRFSYYLSVITIAPVLVVLAIGLSATLMSVTFVQTILAIEPFGTLYYIFVLVVPYITLGTAFTLVYIFLPNTKVKFSAALTGGIFATFIWKLAGYLFSAFIVNSSNYDAIYAGFAALIIFLIWLYVSWLIFLLGGKLTYYLQNLENDKNFDPFN